VESLQGRVTPATLLPLITIPLGATYAGGITDGPAVDKSGNLYFYVNNVSDSSDAIAKVYERHADTHQIEKLATFSRSRGDEQPYSHLIIDNSGTIYGTTFDTVFKITRGSGSPQILPTSNDTIGYGMGDLLLANGVLYDATYEGGPNGLGTVFSLPVGGGTASLLGTFDGANGQAPTGGLTLSQGILYGTTQYGEEYRSGTVFSVPAGGGSITTLASFTGDTPNGHLVISDGYAIGTSYNYNGGSLFKVAVAGGPLAIVPVRHFDIDPFDPESGLINDGGTILGTSVEGGRDDTGDLFQVNPTNMTVMTLGYFPHHGTFTTWPGVGPFGSLAVDGRGNVYGASTGGFSDPSHDTAIFWKLSGLKVSPIPNQPAPSVVLRKISTNDSTNLTIEYTIAHNDANAPFALDVYRSTAGSWNQGQRVAVATVEIGGKLAHTGPHAIVVGPASPLYGFLPSQADALRPDLKYTHVLAVADPTGALNPADLNKPPSASFTIHVIAVIVHGYSTDLATAQATNMVYAKLLQANGYQIGMAWDWASTTSQGTPGTPILKLLPNSARALADSVEAEARRISAGNDIVDVNFIGYSRGAVLVSKALDDIYEDNRSSKAIQQLKSGYMMEMLIDPHPANNGSPPAWVGPAGWEGENHQYSADHGMLVDAVVGATLSVISKFQGAVNDPNVSIPPNVRAAADFYQHTSVSELSGSEGYVNLWGEDPSLITNRSTVKIRDLNVTGQGIGHFETLNNLFPFLITSHKTLAALGLNPF
jgi:uncharacterized repeat protein (TIGR03803 family)